MTAQRFVDNGDGTVTDRRTCLQWEKKTGVPSVGQNFYYALPADWHDVNARVVFGTTGSIVIDAHSFVSVANQEAFAGHGDWRLPTGGNDGAPQELESILLNPCPCTTPGACSSSVPPCIDPAFGPSAGTYYHTGSPYLADPQLNWRVQFFYGGSGASGGTTTAAVRLVRRQNDPQ